MLMLQSFSGAGSGGGDSTAGKKNIYVYRNFSFETKRKKQNVKPTLRSFR